MSRRIDPRYVRQAQRVVTKQAVYEPYVALAEHARRFGEARAERLAAAARQRQEIRAALAEGYGPLQVAAVFGCALSVVQRIQQEGEPDVSDHA